MGVHLRHFPEHRLELVVLCSFVTAGEMLRLFDDLDRMANLLCVFSDEVDFSGVDVAQIPVIRRAAAISDVADDRELPRRAFVSSCKHSDFFVRFWIHYASAGAQRAPNRAEFPSIAAACQWLGLLPAAAGALSAAAAEAIEAEAGMTAHPEKATANRHRILRAASRLFRERGFDGATEDEIMDAAGLPSGGFHSYFKDKNDLIFHALFDAMADFSPPAELGEWALHYLSAAHKADPAGGCPLAALAQETARQSPEARAAATAVGLSRQIEHLSRSAPGHDAPARRRAGVRALTAAVGAVMLARLSDDQDLAAELLGETRAWITDESALLGASATGA